MSGNYILLLEDDEDVAELLVLVLRAAGYIVDLAITVAQAERRLAERGYGLVIADWRLPDGDGTIVADRAADLGAKTAIPNGRLPAPPHDATGHTWHHSDRQLFAMTKNGTAGMMPGYQTDMPAYKDVLSDVDIWAVLSYIESTWPADIRERQQRLNHVDK
jgi:hypothetical protein